MRTLLVALTCLAVAGCDAILGMGDPSLYLQGHEYSAYRVDGNSWGEGTDIGWLLDETVNCPDSAEFSSRIITLERYEITFTSDGRYSISAALVYDDCTLDTRIEEPESSGSYSAEEVLALGGDTATVLRGDTAGGRLIPNAFRIPRAVQGWGDETVPYQLELVRCPDGGGAVNESKLSDCRARR